MKKTDLKTTPSKLIAAATCIAALCSCHDLDEELDIERFGSEGENASVNIYVKVVDATNGQPVTDMDMRMEKDGAQIKLIQDTYFATKLDNFFYSCLGKEFAPAKYLLNISRNEYSPSVWEYSSPLIENHNRLYMPVIVEIEPSDGTFKQKIDTSHSSEKREDVVIDLSEKYGNKSMYSFTTNVEIPVETGSIVTNVAEVESEINRISGQEAEWAKGQLKAWLARHTQYESTTTIFGSASIPGQIVDVRAKGYYTRLSYPATISIRKDNAEYSITANMEKVESFCYKLIGIRPDEVKSQHIIFSVTHKNDVENMKGGGGACTSGYNWKTPWE